MPEDGSVLLSHPSQPALSLAKVVVAAELVVREKKQRVRRSIWWEEGEVGDLQYRVQI